MQRILRGEDPLPPSQSENAVEDVPDNFADWVRAKSAKIENASSLPFFVRDNKDKVNQIIDESRYDKFIGEGIISHLRGYPITDEFLRLKSHAAVAELLQHNLSSSGTPVKVEVDARLIPLRVAKAYASTLSELNREYLLLQAPLGVVKLGYKPEDPLEFGCTYFNHDTREPKIVSLVQSRETRNSKHAIRSSRCDKRRNGIATATHEFAHLLYSVRTADVSISPFETALLEIWKQYENDIAKSIATNNIDEMATWYLGNYANNTVDEFMAEAFQEYKNCSNPTKYATAVGLLVDRFFKR